MHLFVNKWALPERFRDRGDSEHLYFICICSELVSMLRVYTDYLGPWATLHTMYGIAPSPPPPSIQCMANSLIQCMRLSPIQCTRLSRIQCIKDLGPWRPDAWTRKIRFPHLVKNSLRTPILDYDFVNVWPEATHGSFCPCLGTSEETAPNALHHTMYGRLLHTMYDEILHTIFSMFVFVCLYLYVCICIYKLMYKIYKIVYTITWTKLSS